MDNLFLLFDGYDWSFVCGSCYVDLCGPTQWIPPDPTLVRAASVALDRHQAEGGGCQWCEERYAAVNDQSGGLPVLTLEGRP
jgi:hypothetical protein